MLRLSFTFLKRPFIIGAAGAVLARGGRPGARERRGLQSDRGGGPGQLAAAGGCGSGGGEALPVACLSTAFRG